jgi:hypothetical protein
MVATPEKPRSDAEQSRGESSAPTSLLAIRIQINRRPACSRLNPAWTISNQRPHLPSLLESAFELPGCVGIASCGPTSFTDDVRRAVASKQKSMALGHDVRDVELHTEEFDW